MPTTTSAPEPSVMLHLGLGSFHRAHQAFYQQQLHDAGDRSWVLAGGNTRPDMLETMAALARQGGAYTLETVSPAGERRYERISAIQQILPYEPGLANLLAVGAAPSTRILSFTVTEAGYYLDAKNRLDLSFPDLAADLEGARQGKPGGVIYAALTAILRARMQRDAGDVTLLCCDNLRHNGDRSRSGLLQFIELVGDQPLHAWVSAHTTSPNAMVDRIVPRPTPEVAERVLAATQWADGAPVMGESFIQWVIEDRFCNGRPAWEKVGVELVQSVAPYEEAKIRLLNASHCCIAWAGVLLGHQFIHEATHHPAIRQMAFDYVTKDAIPCLSTPGQESPVDLVKYRDVVLDRFSNPAIRDSVARVAMDGFSKLPGFIVPTIRERLGRDESIDSVAMLPALFLAFLQRWHRDELAFTYQDQAMDPAAAHAICTSADPALALCREPVLWGPLAGDPRLVRALGAATVRVADFVRQYGG